MTITMTLATDVLASVIPMRPSELSDHFDAIGRTSGATTSISNTITSTTITGTYRDFMSPLALLMTKQPSISAPFFDDEKEYDEMGAMTPVRAMQYPSSVPTTPSINVPLELTPAVDATFLTMAMTAELSIEKEVEINNTLLTMISVMIATTSREAQAARYTELN